MTPISNSPLSDDRDVLFRAALRRASQADGLTTPPAVEQELLRQLRRRNHWRTVRRVIEICAVAATAAVLFFVLPIRKIEPLPAVALTHPATPEFSPVRALESEPQPAAARAARLRPAPAPQPPAIFASDEFIPVGPWQAVEPMERGSIVRVRLPKSVLPGLGIPVSAERWNESIPADLVLGEDGSMRAVRFLNAYQ